MCAASPEQAHEVEARDRVALAKVEPVRLGALSRGVELDARAAVVARPLDEVLVEEAPVAMRAPALRGDEVVDVDVAAADEVRVEPVPGAGTALVAVEDRRYPVTVLVPGGVAVVELLLAEVAAQLS